MFYRKIYSLFLVFIWITVNGFSLDYKFINESNKTVYSSTNLSEILSIMQPGTPPQGVLILPVGTTVITQPIMLSYGQSIIGDPSSNQGSILQMNNAGTTVIHVESGGNLIIKNLVITRSNVSRSGNIGIGIYMEGSSFVTIENCTIRGHSIGIKQGALTGAYLNRYKNCTIEWCLDNAIYMSSFVQFYLSDITCRNIGRQNSQNTAAVWIDGGEGLYIRGLHVYNCTGLGILFTQRLMPNQTILVCQNIYLDDSEFYAMGNHGIDVQSMARLAITDTTSTLCGSRYNNIPTTVIGSSNLTLTSLPLNTYAGIVVRPFGSTWNVGNVIIDSCNTSFNGTFGIAFLDTSYLSILRNKISNNTSIGVYVEEGYSTGSTIWRNTITGSSTALYIDGNGNGLLNAKNTFIGSQSQYINPSITNKLTLP